MYLLDTSLVTSSNRIKIIVNSSFLYLFAALSILSPAIKRQLKTNNSTQLIRLEYIHIVAHRRILSITFSSHPQELSPIINSRRMHAHPFFGPLLESETFACATHFSFYFLVKIYFGNIIKSPSEGPRSVGNTFSCCLALNTKNITLSPRSESTAGRTYLNKSKQLSGAHSI